MAIAINITTASRRAILAGLSFFPFVPAAVSAAEPAADPVLAALERYAQARADAEVVGDAYGQIDTIWLANLITDAENEAAEIQWHDALAIRDAAAADVLRAKPATEDGAIELGRFAATMAQQYALGEAENVRELGVACRTLGDWLVARRRARVGV